jgi:hypothetical protein
LRRLLRKPPPSRRSSERRRKRGKHRITFREWRSLDEKRMDLKDETPFLTTRTGFFIKRKGFKGSRIRGFKEILFQRQRIIKVF